MKLLAIETSSVACSVAANVDDAVVLRHEERPREHTRLLIPMIREVLAESAQALHDLDAIVLGNGPGSFIGVRIGAAVAQGLAHGAGLPIVPVSSLATIAAEVFDRTDAPNVAVAEDAHRAEVYFGHYSRGQDDLPVETTSERLQPITRIQELNDHRSVHAGSGWQHYPDLLSIHAKSLIGDGGVLYPKAVYSLRLAKSAQAMSPESISPMYLRETVAQKPATAST